MDRKDQRWEHIDLVETFESARGPLDVLKCATTEAKYQEAQEKLEELIGLLKSVKI